MNIFPFAQNFFENIEAETAEGKKILSPRNFQAFRRISTVIRCVASLVVSNDVEVSLPYRKMCVRVPVSPNTNFSDDCVRKRKIQCVCSLLKVHCTD